MQSGLSIALNSTWRLAIWNSAQGLVRGMTTEKVNTERHWVGERRSSVMEGYYGRDSGGAKLDPYSGSTEHHVACMSGTRASQRVSRSTLCLSRCFMLRTLTSKNQKYLLTYCPRCDSSRDSQAPQHHSWDSALALHTVVSMTVLQFLFAGSYSLSCSM
jgi:hypothetical protein